MSNCQRSFVLFAMFVVSIWAQEMRAQSASLSTALMKHVRHLASDSLQGRQVGTAGNAAARTYIIDALRENGASPYSGAFEHPIRFLHPVERHVIEGVNVMAMIPGKKYRDKYIVIGAHYDHLGIRSGQVYNGADDNASGTAGLLELVRLFSKKPTKHTLIFVAFDAEEMGLRGARYLINEEVVPTEDIVMMLNMDMVGRSAKNRLIICGTYYYPALLPYCDRTVKDRSIDFVYGHDGPEWTGSENWTYASDHGPFHDVGIPFLYLGVEDHEDYHQPTDDADAIQPEFLTSVTEYAYDLIRLLDKKWRKISKKL